MRTAPALNSPLAQRHPAGPACGPSRGSPSIPSGPGHDSGGQRRRLPLAEQVFALKLLNDRLVGPMRQNPRDAESGSFGSARMPCRVHGRCVNPSLRLPDSRGTVNRDIEAQLGTRSRSCWRACASPWRTVCPGPRHPRPTCPIDIKAVGAVGHNGPTYNAHPAMRAVWAPFASVANLHPFQSGSERARNPPHLRMDSSPFVFGGSAAASRGTNPRSHKLLREETHSAISPSGWGSASLSCQYLM